MRTRKEWRSAWVLAALHTLMAQVLYAPTATTATIRMHARHTATTARIGSREEFSSARARGSTATDAEDLTLIVGDSATVVLDSTAAEVGSLDPVGVASLLRAALEGDLPAAAPDEDSLAAALRGDPAVVSEAVPWVVGSTAVADLTAVAATGN